MPCDIDPKRGTASFDGITIRADPITEPRWDRVFAILEEEQVVMCRQMAPILREQPGALALDIGTGSGVFAIWAARQGCRAIALDVSPRAVRTARENVLANGLTLADSPDRLQPGSVCVLNQRFDEDFAEAWTQRFHVALMNPPYNPTYAGVFPALHCEAGEDGQRVFREQIAAVPAVLEAGGVCIGDQFTIVEADGTVEALRLIGDAFGSDCTARWAWLVPGTMPVRRFLEEQYSSYLRTPLKPGSRDGVAHYVDRMDAGGRHFAVVYFEVRREPPAPGDPRFQEFELAQTPGFGWDARIWEHRCFVDYASPLTEAADQGGTGGSSV